MPCLTGATSRVQALPVAGSFATSPFHRGTPLLARPHRGIVPNKMPANVQAVASEPALQRPDSTGRYGKFGGKYVPETLITALAELEQAYAEAMNDPAFVVRIIFAPCLPCGCHVPCGSPSPSFASLTISTGRA